MKQITTDELRSMRDREGLIIQGCGGDLSEWIAGINDILTQEGILQNGDTFKEVYSFEHGGLTNLLFSMENVDLHTGGLAMWRLQSHSSFGGTWLSDYLPNRLGVNMDEPPAHKEKTDCLIEIHRQRYSAGYIKTGSHRAGKEKPMKALKNDGSIYVEQITAAIAECYEGGDNPSNQSLLELYTFIGQHICRQGEKAFVAHLAEMLAVQFPTLKGFSLRNLRRMRDFYRTYENNPALMEKAQSLSWTQNTVILECCESDEQRFFYIDLTVEQNLSKLALMKAIAKNAFAAASDIETPAENVEPSSAPVGDIFAKAAVDTATSVGTACGSFVTACEPPRQGDRLQRTADIEQISNSIRTNRKTDEPSSLFGHTKPLLNYATPLAVRTDRPKRTREPPPGTQHPQQTSLRFYGLQYVNRQRVQQHTQISA